MDESSSGPGFFPKICFFCKAWKRYFNRKRTVPHTITTTDAVKRISEAAEMKKDEELLPSIRGVDLIAKEFMMHMKCYKDCIRVLSQSANDEKECPREVGDFNAVKNFIQNQVLCNNQAVSITALHRLYKIGYGSEHERSYRGKLKKRILDEFEDAMTFLSVNKSTREVVVSTAGLDSTTIVNDKDNILN